MSDTLTVEIPDDVRDNSETVIDYAFMRHRSPDRGVRTPQRRDDDLNTYRLFLTGYDVFTWRDTNPNGQRCRFDMVINQDGAVCALYHTEYFTRVACHTGDWCSSYAARYVLAIKDGEPTTDGALPYCERHIKSLSDTLTLHLSEPLRIGQH